MEYFVIFIDNFSCYGYIYLIYKKLKVFDKSQEYKMEVEHQLNRNIKILWPNHGGEFILDLYNDFWKKYVIIY